MYLVLITRSLVVQVVWLEVVCLLCGTSCDTQQAAYVRTASNNTYWWYNTGTHFVKSHCLFISIYTSSSAQFLDGPQSIAHDPPGPVCILHTHSYLFHAWYLVYYSPAQTAGFWTTPYPTYITYVRMYLCQNEKRKVSQFFSTEKKLRKGLLCWLIYCAFSVLVH